MADIRGLKDRVRSFARGASGETSRLWIAGAAVLLVILSFRSCTSPDPG